MHVDELGSAVRALWMLGWLTLAATPAVASADQVRETRRVRIVGERLSLHVEGLPFGELLAELARNGRVTVQVHGDPSALTVSDSFDGLDVAQALRRVLSGNSHVLIDRGSHERAPRIIELILLPGRSASSDGDSRRSATGDEYVPPGAASSPAELLANAVLSAASPEERAAAAEELAYRPDPEELGYADQVLTRQLSDPDEQVRRRALETLKDTADAVPVDAITQVAREDASAERRVQALELLAERTERRARGPLRSALADPAPEVSARARELIEEWHLEDR